MQEPSKIDIYLDSDYPSTYLMHSDGSFEVLDGFKAGCIVTTEPNKLPNPAAAMEDGVFLGYFNWSLGKYDDLIFTPAPSSSQQPSES